MGTNSTCISGIEIETICKNARCKASKRGASVSSSTVIFLLLVSLISANSSCSTSNKSGDEQTMTSSKSTALPDKTIELPAGTIQSAPPSSPCSSLYVTAANDFLEPYTSPRPDPPPKVSLAACSDLNGDGASDVLLKYSDRPNLGSHSRLAIYLANQSTKPLTPLAIEENTSGWADNVKVRNETSKGWQNIDFLFEGRELTTVSTFAWNGKAYESISDYSIYNNTKFEKIMYVKNDQVNVRKKPLATAPILNTLPMNSQIHVSDITSESDSNSWVLINFDGKQGWVSTEFLSESKTLLDKISFANGCVTLSGQEFCIGNSVTKYGFNEGWYEFNKTIESKGVSFMGPNEEQEPNVERLQTHIASILITKPFSGETEDGIRIGTPENEVEKILSKKYSDYVRKSFQAYTTHCIYNERTCFNVREGVVSAVALDQNYKQQ